MSNCSKTVVIITNPYLNSILLGGGGGGGGCVKLFDHTVRCLYMKLATAYGYLLSDPNYRLSTDMDE